MLDDVICCSKDRVADDSRVEFEVEHGLILLSVWIFFHLTFCHLLECRVGLEQNRLILGELFYSHQLFSISRFWISEQLLFLGLLGQDEQYFLDLGGERRLAWANCLLKWHRNVTLVAIIVLWFRRFEEVLRASLLPEFKPWIILYWLDCREWWSLLDLFVGFHFIKRLNVLVGWSVADVVLDLGKLSAGGLAGEWGAHLRSTRRISFESRGSL